MKFGRKPALHDRWTMLSMLTMARHLTTLGAPPPRSADYVSAVEKVLGGPFCWGLLGNSQYGDCVEASEGHALMLRTANTGAIVIPTVADILALYTAETGFNPNDPASDQGTSETLDCDFMETTGLLGHRAVASGMVDPTNLDHIRWCIQLFGTCKIGILVPASAMGQFESGLPWEATPDDGGILGGHDVPLVAYYEDGSFDCITWGRRQRIEPSFLEPETQYLEEAHAQIFPDFVTATGSAPNGFSLQQLIDDLPEVITVEPPFSPDPWRSRRRHRRRRHHDAQP